MMCWINLFDVDCYLCSVVARLVFYEVCVKAVKASKAGGEFMRTDGGNEFESP
jgi:hypothetical protein